MKTVILNVGHRKKPDSGAFNSDLNVTEWFLNNLFVDKVMSIKSEKIRFKKLIRKKGLSKHIKTEVNTLNPDLSIAFHFNSHNNKKANGTEVLYYPGNKVGENIAAELSNVISSIAETVNRGAIERGDLAFLNQTNHTAVLIEPCFMSNSTDVAKFFIRIDEIATAFVKKLEELIN
jgi:N-acetylmuramoyl-L-alanine amidase